ncbi:MAG: phosphate ABC transporter permease PstA [Defluviitaleaceae bacterium]|nr:phosphate ABC transporter permease PstA [Defluviitaleaceae bacterium]
MQKRRISDYLMTALIWLSATATASILLIIVGFIFSNGWRLISPTFLTREANDTLRIVNFESESMVTAEIMGDLLVVEGIGLTLERDETYGIKVNHVAADAPGRHALDNAGEIFPIRRGQVLEGINEERIHGGTTLDEISTMFDNHSTFTFRIRQLGGGIFPMLISTLMLIFTTLLIATPLGVLAAIYMVEYAKQGRIVNMIRFAIEILAGLPSVVHGLFGMLFFSRILGLGMSVLSGALTLTVLLLPIMIRSTEESLKTVPNSYREASLGLGANKIQTIRKIILPSALPGITVGIILSIGRIVGESAALLFTLGTFARIPVNPATGNLSIFEAGATLTLRAFIEVQEFGNIEMASAIGIVILVIVFTLNLCSKLMTKKFGK